ncbi:MAG: hypothetical protein CMD25_09460 [Flavobacteriales bacterium]|nr:hypothetical protein [Flavobacteriales bacterium]
MKQLWVDVDSTLNNHWVRIQKWAIPSFPGNSIDRRAFTREEIMKDEPLPNAVETLKEFSKEWDIHILSARGFDDAWNITKDWLDKHNFSYTTIGIVREAKDKISILRSVEVDLFIDDLSRGQHFGPSYVELYNDVIQELDNLGINYELFKNNWLEIKERHL